MALARSPKSRRLFGGKPATPTTTYVNPLDNPADQANAETLTVGTTRRVCKGPGGQGGFWSYHVYNATASGATSNMKIYFSNLPNPDPATAAHWKDSGITAIDLTTTATSTQATRASDYYEWIMFEATAVTSGGTMWAYARVTEDGQG